VKLNDPKVQQVMVRSTEQGTAPARTDRVKASGGHTEIEMSGKQAIVITGDKPISAKPKPLPMQEQSFDSLLIEPVTQAGVVLAGAPVGGELDEVRQWVLVVRATQTPLRWDAERRAYTTELIVGLQGAGSHRGTKAKLSTPVAVRLTGNGAKLNPALLTLDEGGIAGFRTAVIALHDHAAKGTVTALSDLGEQAYAVSARPQLGSLRLELAKNSIAGFGIGTTTLSAVRLAEDGRDWFSPERLDVQLSIRGNGDLEPELLTFEPNKARSEPVEFRSASLGEATIVAQGTGISPSEGKVSFAAPWALLIAVLVGATLGAGLRALKKTEARRREFSINFLSGLLMSLATLLGVANLAGLPDTALLTEAGCFVIAGIAAYLGTPALNKMGSFRAHAQPST
jgi:hypothetical protein